MTRGLAAQAAPSTTVASVEAHDAPSWIDRLQIAIESLPGPWWLAYVAAFALLQAAGHAIRWADGSLPVGTLAPERAPMFGALFPTFILAATHYLDRLADRQYARFRPALDVDPERARRLHRNLTTMPARPVRWLTVLAGGPPAVVYVATFDTTTSAGILAWALSLALVPAAIAGGAIFCYHAVHQLIAVDRLHEAPTRVDLFRPRPLSAFSVLAARSGIAFLVLAYYAAAVRPDLVLSNVVGLANVLAAITCGVLSFVLPLWGLHRRLAAEKLRLVSAADDRLRTAVLRELDPGEEGGATDQVADLGRLRQAREVVAGLRTWPWSLPTLTGFVSAIVIPILIWAITRFLERLVA